MTLFTDAPMFAGATGEFVKFLASARQPTHSSWNIRQRCFQTRS